MSFVHYPAEFFSAVACFSGFGGFATRFAPAAAPPAAAGGATFAAAGDLVFFPVLRWRFFVILFRIRYARCRHLLPQ